MKHNAVVVIVLFLIVGSPVFAQEQAPVSKTVVKTDEVKAATAKDEVKALPAASVQAVSAQPDAKVVPVKSAPPAVKVQEEKLPWWPTDAQPAPVPDKVKGGYWWWPQKPGTVKDLWGNRGYAYANKIIYDWHKGTGGTGGNKGVGGAGVSTGTGVTKADGGRGAPAKIGRAEGTSGDIRDVQVTINDVVGSGKTEPKPSLLVKRTIKGLKLSFTDNSVSIEPKHASVLKKSVDTLKRNTAAHILISGEATSEAEIAQVELRSEAVQKYMLDQGIEADRINILAPGKLEESGMSSKKENTPGAIQILIAEVQEVMIPGPKN